MGILSMATDRARKRWATKLPAAHPHPRFFPRSPLFLCVPSQSAPEGNVIDFIRNNRRVGEGARRKPTALLQGGACCMCERIWPPQPGCESSYFGSRPLTCRTPAPPHPPPWLSASRRGGPGGGVAWGAVGEKSGAAGSWRGRGDGASERCCFWPPALFGFYPPPLLRVPRAGESGPSGPPLAWRPTPAPAVAPSR